MNGAKKDSTKTTMLDKVEMLDPKHILYIYNAALCLKKYAIDKEPITEISNELDEDTRRIRERIKSGIPMTNSYSIIRALGEGPGDVSNKILIDADKASSTLESNIFKRLEKVADRQEKSITKIEKITDASLDAYKHLIQSASVFAKHDAALNSMIN